MENRERINQSFFLPTSLDVKQILDKNKIPKPEDWVAVQGGEPVIEWVNKDLCYVVHNYVNKKDPSGTGKKVTTPISVIKDWGTSEIVVGGRVVAFPRALLWSRHGKPCEGVGRTEYDRVDVKTK